MSPERVTGMQGSLHCLLSCESDQTQDIGMYLFPCYSLSCFNYDEDIVIVLIGFKKISLGAM